MSSHPQHLSHPKYGKPLSGAPSVVDDVTFRPYRMGVGQYVHCDDGFRISVWRWRSTYQASVDGVNLGKRFRSEINAARAAVKAMRGSVAA